MSLKAICDCGAPKHEADTTCGECLRHRLIAEFEGGIGNFESMDPERFCTAHGLPRIPGEYGRPYVGCQECDFGE